MKYLFPYHQVKKDSNIILYGDGGVGKEFYLQLYYNKYCNVVAWVDKAFDYYEVSKPFDKVENIDKYNYDCIVIAVESADTCSCIKQSLIKMEIPEEKIVWNRFYTVDHGILPYDRMKYLTNWDYYINLIDDYMKTEEWFGGSQWYQGSPDLGIEGARKNGERIARYHVSRFLSKESQCLDIGCNCGFFDIALAELVKGVVGIDVEEKYINIANKARDFLDRKNVEFIISDMWKIGDRQFDAVFSLGVHNYIFEAGSTHEQYVARVIELIRCDGYLFFESHGMNSDGKQYKEICDMFVERGLSIAWQCHSIPDGNRNVTVFKKHGS